MSSRIVIRGGTWWGSPEFHRGRRESANAQRAVPFARRPTRDMPGEMVDLAPVNDAPTRLVAGLSFRCPEDDVVYRIVPRLDPSDGWAPTEFWQKRWDCRHSDVLSLVRRGLLDAAITEGSQVRRYRCRDEAQVKKSAVLANKERRRAKYVEKFGKR